GDGAAGDNAFDPSWATLPDTTSTAGAAAGSGGTGTPAVAMGGSGGTAGVSSGTACEPGKFCAPEEPDPTDCGKLELTTNLKTVLQPGNVLVVFDRSGSMEGNWNGLPKYQA